MSTQLSPIVLLPNEGKSLIVSDNVNIGIKAAGANTGGQWVCLEYSVLQAPFEGPPLHRHKITHEAWYILEGTFTFLLDGQSIEAPAGSFVYVPPGVLHRFCVTGSAPAKFLGFASPPAIDFEGYANELKALMQQEPSWPPADMSKVNALMARYDTYAE
ncbi:MAG: cupin domain-containing protein [Anaerolineae bacterium]|nr:cupin domain-containing protein [Anaerolineae bacterium]NUQ07188.1 cupin domain-containing protein [Anaerolineae bacterium]